MQKFVHPVKIAKQKTPKQNYFGVLIFFLLSLGVPKFREGGAIS